MQRLHVKYDIVFGNDGTVSIPNMFLRTVVGEDIYLKGTYDEATKQITIENNQEIYNQDGISLYICPMDYKTKEPLSTASFKLSLDSESESTTLLKANISQHSSPTAARQRFTPTAQTFIIIRQSYSQRQFHTNTLTTTTTETANLQLST